MPASRNGTLNPEGTSSNAAGADQPYDRFVALFSVAIVMLLVCWLAVACTANPDEFCGGLNAIEVSAKVVGGGPVYFSLYLPFNLSLSGRRGPS